MTERKWYTKAFKLDAVSLVLERGHTRADAAKMLEISLQMLGHWVREYQGNKDGQAESPGEAA